ncbi:MAG TPA: SMC family ATPase, partial [Acidimicrobiales bacterium]|nr:SMC family ATPase [Acidimicrobiales bacterium]
MRITRLHLRNYRVYQEALDLELPPGLVGIYGANGSGKSTLIEAIPFALFGYSRTPNNEIRTSGVNDDCIVEVEFEHEGHLYVVRRMITGANHQPKATVHADGLQVADGVTDAKRYIHSVLGMDKDSFRASVFAEQKQIAAFSTQTPAARRDLVLKLLGITPLDAARDNARKDARLKQEAYERSRELLPDLDALRTGAADAKAAADARAADAASEATAAETATAAVQKAESALEKLDDTRQEHELLVAEGKAVRKEHDTAVETVDKLTAELELLATAGSELASLEPQAVGLAEAEAKLRTTDAVVKAAAALAAVAKVTAPPAPDEDACEKARAAADEAAGLLAQVDGELTGANAELQRARAALEKSADLSDEGECPLCGQELGDAFAQVQHHRATDVADAEARVAALTARRKEAAAGADAAKKAATVAAKTLKDAQAAWAAYEQASARRADVEALLAKAVDANGGPATDEDLILVGADVQARRNAAEQCTRLRTRLERKPQLEIDLEKQKGVVADAGGRLQNLRDKVKAIGFKPEKLDAAREARNAARAAAEAASKRAHEASVAAATAAAAAAAAEEKLVEGEANHARLADTAEDARHLSRFADLMNAFRKAVVGAVGPRLSAQAAELFAELTDREYDRLDVDPETYEIQIVDSGTAYGVKRFSGSETDLANLSLRVAISEQVRFQSGGAVGLLVLDEVFGPLDPDRKERMLLALERLKGRFRQVLVVT